MVFPSTQVKLNYGDIPPGGSLLSKFNHALATSPKQATQTHIDISNIRCLNIALDVRRETN